MTIPEVAAKPTLVKVVAIDIPIGDLMALYIRCIVAAIPVAFLLAIIVFLAGLLWRTISTTT